MKPDCNMFGDLAMHVLQVVMLELHTSGGIVYLVADTYPPISIKGYERKMHSSRGALQVVINSADQHCPTQRGKFLAASGNKMTLHTVSCGGVETCKVCISVS